MTADWSAQQFIYIYVHLIPVCKKADRDVRIDNKAFFPHNRVRTNTVHTHAFHSWFMTSITTMARGLNRQNFCVGQICSPRPTYIQAIYAGASSCLAGPRLHSTLFKGASLFRSTSSPFPLTFLFLPLAPSLPSHSLLFPVEVGPLNAVRMFVGAL